MQTRFHSLHIIRTVLATILFASVWLIADQASAETPKAIANAIVASGAYDKAASKVNDNSRCAPRLRDPESMWGCNGDDFASVILVLVSKGKYSTAAKYLNDFKIILVGIRPPQQCWYSWITVDSNKGYFVGYEQVVYQILLGQKSPAAKKQALKAFLCQSWQTNGFNKKFEADWVNVDLPRLDRKNFVATVTQLHGNGTAFDVDRYLDEILATAFKAREQLLDGVSHQDKRGKVAGWIKYSVVLKNAAKHAHKIGLNREFIDFLSAASKEASTTALEIQND